MRYRRGVQEYIPFVYLRHKIGEKRAELSQFTPRSQDDCLRFAGSSAGIAEAQGLIQLAVHTAGTASPGTDHACQFGAPNKNFGIQTVEIVVDDSTASAVLNFVDMVR